MKYEPTSKLHIAGSVSPPLEQNVQVGKRAIRGPPSASSLRVIRCGVDCKAHLRLLINAFDIGQPVDTVSWSHGGGRQNRVVMVIVVEETHFTVVRDELHIQH